MNPAARLHVAVVVALALAGAGLHGCAGGGGGGGGRPGPLPAGTPAILSIEPSAAAAGALVTIAGTDFEMDFAAEVVFFGDTEARLLATDPSSILCEVPAGAVPGAAPVTVTTRRGSVTHAFTVLASAPGAPTLTGLEPRIGPPGTVVTIAGTGFSAAAAENVVTLCGEAVAVRAVEAGRLAIEVPEGATAGKVVVWVAGGPPSNGLPFGVTSARRPGEDDLGDRNRDLVSASRYTHLVIEVDVEAGVPGPGEAALERVAQALAARIWKPGGIAVVVDPPFPPTGIESWTPSLLIQQGVRVRDHHDGPNLATLHVTVVGGAYVEDELVLGLALTGSGIATFGARLGEAPAVVSANLLVHEIGHLLGLVDLTTPMVSPHEARDKPAHDASPACLMYWQLGLGRGAPPLGFCPLCIQDLRAIGGK